MIVGKRGRLFGACLLAMLTLAEPAFLAAGAGQAGFESTVAELSSPDAKVRGRAVELLTAAAYYEAATPLAALVTDPVDEIQMDAIAAELNIFLAQKLTPKKRVGLIVEVRDNISAEPIFTAGSTVLGPQRVPLDVANALLSASVDRTIRVAYESIYAFGSLAGEVSHADRPALLKRAGPIYSGLVSLPDPTMRIAALRVAGRVFARRPGDQPLDQRFGDSVVTALNAFEPPVRETAMWALGMMRYDRAAEGLSKLLTYYRKGPLAERAFEAMARIGHESSMPQFVERLNSDDRAIRKLAIEGIARTNNRERLVTIQNATKSDKNEVLLLAGHFANVKLADGPVTTIVESLDRSQLREQALQYVYELAPGRAATFGALVRSPKGVRLDVVDALGASGDAAALPFVQPLTTDKDPAVVLAAQRAVARLTK